MGTMSMWVQVVPVMAAGHGRSRNSCVPHLTENNRAAQSVSPISRGPRAILKSGKEASTPSKRSRTRRKAFLPEPPLSEFVLVPIRWRVIDAIRRPRVATPP